MKMPFGKYRGQDISRVPEGYLSWAYTEYKPLVLEIERKLKITPRERRSEKVEVEIMFEEYERRNPDAEVISEIKEDIMSRLYPSGSISPQIKAHLVKRKRNLTDKPTSR